MGKKITAVFDIGRTNKKFFLFDGNFEEVYREYTAIEEIVDEDGYPTEDLNALTTWTKEVFNRILRTGKYPIDSLNFSCYGASLVHIDEHGKVLTPLYNYMKPIAEEITTSFYEKYGPEDQFTRITGSLKLGMLNTGMHLYWLKRTKPDVFKKIKYSLHLSQYLSYCFTDIPLSEFTNIGCHTILWDYEKKEYHSWVTQEAIHHILPPMAATNTYTTIAHKDTFIRIGVGIHDSSSALLPYIRSIEEPFILVSTGTWSITINPFTTTSLTLEDIHKDCLYNMRLNGDPVKVSRLFLGNEHELQIKFLASYFNVSETYHKQLTFQQNIYREIHKAFQYSFKWISIEAENMPRTTTIPYDSFEYAYHHLMIELVLLQVQGIRNTIGDDSITQIFVDGGFSGNDIYINLLAHYLRDMEVWTTDASLGSALGAAICISDSKLDSKFLKKNYSLQKHLPFTIK